MGANEKRDAAYHGTEWVETPAPPGSVRIEFHMAEIRAEDLGAVRAACEKIRDQYAQWGSGFGISTPRPRVTPKPKEPNE